MHTHYLGQEEVLAYCRDLVARLKAMGACIPTVWCPIGRSGEELAASILGTDQSLIPSTSLVRVDYNRDSEQVTCTDGDIDADVPGKHVMVLDSSVHSGATMSSIVERVAGAGPASICTYSLVLKRSAAFIPSFWGVTINDHDRAYFLLDELPNNRLSPKTPSVHIRRLGKRDLGKPPVLSGLKSLDRITWCDRFYDMESGTRNRVSYILESKADILGYVTVTFANTAMFIDEVAVAEGNTGKGNASALVRWAETCARQACAEEIRLWGVASAAPMYEHLGYKKLGQEMQLGDELYHLMSKRVMYYI
jgi:GNAT superfamily N-acetyltransferase